MNKEEQNWRVVFLIIPTIFGYNLANVIAPDDNMGLLYAILFSGSGALVGAVVYFLIKEKSKNLKIASAVGIFGIGILALYLAA